jgi:hypothetical protein
MSLGRKAEKRPDHYDHPSEAVLSSDPELWVWKIRRMGVLE